MLDEKFLRRLELMRIHMRHSTTGGIGGLRRSKALGTSVEFSDFREYVAGDDLRRVDWNAYARFDKLFIKLFMEERETQVQVILDASGSMNFGDGSKWSAAMKLTEAIAYLALVSGDTVTVTALQNGEAKSMHPQNGRKGYMAITSFLEKQVPAGNTDLSTAISKIIFPAGRGVCIFISDFLNPSGYESALQYLLYQKQEITALQILCKQEEEPDFENHVLLTDTETGEQMEVAASYEVIKAYENALSSFLGGIQRFCLQRAIQYSLFHAEDNLEEMMILELAQIGLLA